MLHPSATYVFGTLDERFMWIYNKKEVKLSKILNYYIYLPPL
jgi:hypothetical protein